MTATTTKPQRIYSIDMLKGICMLFMLVDHWRIHLSYLGQHFLGKNSIYLPIDAGNLENVNTVSFWLLCLGSYFVAPSFLFLAGAGCYLWQIRRGANASLFKYLLIRGSMLAMVNCLLFFNAPFSQGGVITLHVLWPAGIGMIILGCIAKWPKALLWTLALICIIGQNFFESISFTLPIISTIWNLAFIETYIPLPWGASLYNLWPIMPWFGILLIGYLCGPIFLKDNSKFETWAKLGLFCLVSYLFLRLTGLYGDPSQWQLYDSTLKTLGALVTLKKYPPSLQFILYGLSITFFLLALLERYNLTNKMLLTFGAMPLFFYIAHIILLRSIKFIIVNLPTFILDTIKNILFSPTSIILGTTCISFILFILCNLYKHVLKKYKLYKQKNTL